MAIKRQNLKVNRKPTDNESALLEYLVSTAIVTFPADWKETLMVTERDDKGTGSLYLLPKPGMEPNRVYGKTVSEYQVEEDGILVIASLNVDTNGELLELDIWRGDITPPEVINLN